MVSIQERLQRKREPIDKWSTREQLCLASAVVRSGDQNWMSVSRALKPFGEPNRPTDWFNQKNCAAQYGAMLENVETPKRKKRVSGGTTEMVMETPAEIILRKLSSERREELRRLLAEEKAEYHKLQEEMALLQSGNVTEEQLDRWCKEIDEEEAQRDQEALAHAQWLKEREARKQEIERAWRPANVKGAAAATAAAAPTPPITVGQKRKASDALENLMDLEQIDENQQQQFAENPSRPALSPLLTSLLKSPSQVSNTAVLHTAIARQATPIVVSSANNPTIASLLNSSPNVNVSPGLQHLVTTAINQQQQQQVNNTLIVNSNDLLEDDGVDSIPNIKMEDLECSILNSDEPLPEIKNEEVEVIISDLIENAHDIVNDPEQHLNMGDNDDIITNLENVLEELEEEEKSEEKALQQKQQEQAALIAAAAAAQPPPPPTTTKSTEKEMPTHDPFEFEEEPEYPPTKPSGISTKQSDGAVVSKPSVVEDDLKPVVNVEEEINKNVATQQHSSETFRGQQQQQQQESGSVEIVEVVVMEDEKTNESQDEETPIKDDTIESEAELTESDKIEEDHGVFTETSNDIDIKSETKETIDLDVGGESSRRNTFTPEFTEELLYDDLNIEVTKLDKSGKAKRDYSRTKKKEDKEFDYLLAVDKATMDDGEEVEKKFAGAKIKSETERSSSPWTEEDDMFIRRRRRYSTPATPSDSVPNSPASGTTEDDRDYRNWKKSVMLVYSRFTTHKYASLFLKPITDEQAPGYHSVIYRPMDLLTIRKNIENGAIRTNSEFQRDVLLMFTNAIMYNKTNEHVFNMARQMQLECIQQIQLFLQAQAQTDALPRRETRTSESGSKRKRVSEDLTRLKKQRKDD